MATAALFISTATIAAIWALFALGLNIKFGYAGLLDFGHVAFFLVGAYTAALIVAPPSGTQEFQEYILGLDLPARFIDLLGLQLAGGLGWLVALLLATVVAGIVGLLVALPAIRLREDYLAIALLGISVIVKRTVQTETWLANGPDALRGYPRPLVDLFPLPGFEVEGTVLYAGLVFVLWTMAITLLSRDPLLDAGLRSSHAARSRLGTVLVAVLTLGIGYAAARSARTRRRDDAGHPVLPIVAAALLVAALTGALAAYAYFLPSLLLSLATLSLLVWVYGALWVGRHFETMTRRDWITAVGLAAGLIVAFQIGVVVGDALFAADSTFIAFPPASIVAALGAVAIYGAGAVWWLRSSPRYGGDRSLLSLFGLVGVCLFVFRYFLLSALQTLGDPRAAGGVILQDALFLLQYQGDSITAGLQLNYARFLFIVTVAILGLTYVVAERTVRSPFGRVLKAIREDENVAMALGKNPFSYKVQSMVLGSSIAGLAGGLVAIYYGTLTFRNFEPLITFFIFLIVVIGGTANNKGVVLGAALYWAFVQFSNDMAQQLPTGEAAVFAIRVALLGAVFIAILYYRPQGIWGERTIVEGVTDE